MIGILSLLTIFQYVIGLIFSYLFSLDESLTLRIIAVLCLLFSIICFFANWQKFSKQKRDAAIIFLLLYAFILLSSIPVILIHSDFQLVASEILSFGTRALSGLLMAFWLDNRLFESKIVKWIQPLVIFLTITLLAVVLQNRINSDFANSHMMMSINRQTVAYGAAYSVGLTLFLKIYDKPKKSIYFKLFDNRVWDFASWIIIAVDVYIILSAQGKGAFLLILVIILLYVFYSVAKNGLQANRLLKYAAFCAFLFIGAFLTLSFFDSSNTVISMLTNGFSDRSSLERIALYEKALSAAKARFYFGLGATSVVYDVGFYSHNIFVDLLCDFGVLGVILFIFIIFNVLSVSYKERKNCFLIFEIFIFYFSFVMLLFSGSWMSDSMLWFAIPSVLLFKRIKRTSHNSRIIFPYF